MLRMLGGGELCTESVDVSAEEASSILLRLYDRSQFFTTAMNRPVGGSNDMVKTTRGTAAAAAAAVTTQLATQTSTCPC